MRGDGRYYGRGGFWGDAWKSARNLGRSVHNTLSNAPEPLRMAGRWGLKRALGADVGGAVSRMVGTGGYGQSNELIKGSFARSGIPRFDMENDTNGIVLSHSEYVMDVYSPATPNGTENIKLDLNAGIAATFPLLSQTAADFEEFRILQCILHYKPTLSDYQTTNGQVGTIVMATQHNPSSQNFVTKEQMLAQTGGVSGKATEPIDFGVECNPSKLHTDGKFLVRTGPVQSGLAKSDFDLGFVQMKIMSCPDANLTLGELHISYTVQLLKPRKHSSLGLAIPFFTAQTNQADPSSPEALNPLFSFRNESTGSPASGEKTALYMTPKAPPMQVAAAIHEGGVAPASIATEVATAADGSTTTYLFANTAVSSNTAGVATGYAGAVVLNKELAPVPNATICCGIHPSVLKKFLLNQQNILDIGMSVRKLPYRTWGSPTATPYVQESVDEQQKMFHTTTDDVTIGGYLCEPGSEMNQLVLTFPASLAGVFSVEVSFVFTAGNSTALEGLEDASNEPGVLGHYLSRSYIPTTTWGKIEVIKDMSHFDEVANHFVIGGRSYADTVSYHPKAKFAADSDPSNDTVVITRRMHVRTYVANGGFENELSFFVATHNITDLLRDLVDVRVHVEQYNAIGNAANDGTNDFPMMENHLGQLADYHN